MPLAKWRAAGALIAVLFNTSAFQAVEAGTVGYSYFAPNTVHFDYWDRCHDLRIDPERRIGYCKGMLGTGHALDTFAYTEIGRAYMEERRYDAAIDALDNALSHGTSGLEALAAARDAKDQALAITGQYEHAIADENDIVAKNPVSAAAFNNRCWLRAIAGRELDAALSDCSQAIQLEQASADTLDSRGLIYYRMDKLSDALNDFNAALERAPKLQTSLYVRGIIKLHSGDSQGGNADIDAAKGREPLIAERFASYGVTP